MIHTKPLSHFLALMQGPICLCDGTMPSAFHQEAMERALTALHIPFDTAYNLYEMPGLFELSQYSTLSFGTHEHFLSMKIRKVFGFDKQNLRCIVAQSKQAWELCKDEAKSLGVTVIGFDCHFHNRFDPVPHEIFDHPFFDPETDPHPQKWKW